jgi:cell division protein FtsW
MISRTSRGMVAEWWWTVDRLSFFIVLALIAIGLLLAVAASPAESGGPTAAGNFHFAVRQVAFAALAAGVLIGASMLTPPQIGRAATLLYFAALIGCIAVLFAGEDVLGAKRWLDFGWMKLQPSEFLKPGFAVLAAAVLAAPKSANGKPADMMVSAGLLLPACVVLLLQPDVGQTFLLLALWAALLFFAGKPYAWFLAIGGGAAGLAVAAYRLFGHVHRRIDQFLDHTEAAYQTRLSLSAFAHGGLFGVGPGSGTVKYRLPDAHSDFIFAVAGEEFGFWLCALIALLFCVLAVRLMLRASVARETFAQLAGAGLAAVVALQAFVNMGVAVRLLPAKGMTLPFISYGGSSLFAVAITMGFALALTRQRPKYQPRAQPFDFLSEARS